MDVSGVYKLTYTWRGWPNLPSNFNTEVDVEQGEALPTICFETCRCVPQMVIEGRPKHDHPWSSVIQISETCGWYQVPGSTTCVIWALEKQSLGIQNFAGSTLHMISEETTCPERFQNLAHLMRDTVPWKARICVPRWLKPKVCESATTTGLRS